MASSSQARARRILVKVHLCKAARQSAAAVSFRSTNLSRLSESVEEVDRAQEPQKFKVIHKTLAEDVSSRPCTESTAHDGIPGQPHAPNL